MADSMICHNYRAYDYPAREQNHTFGALFARCLASDDWSDVQGKVFSFDLPDAFTTRTDHGLTHCTACRELKSSSDGGIGFVAAMTARETEGWVCGECLDAEFVYSESEERWLYGEDAIQVDGGNSDIYCSLRYARRHYHFHENSDTWCTEEEYGARCATDERDSDDDDDDDDNDDNDDNNDNDGAGERAYPRGSNPYRHDNVCVIAEYHANKHYLKRVPSPVYDRHARPLLTGIELEIEVGGDRGAAARAVKRIFNATDDYCLIEGDGSLNRGFEVVCGWTGLDTHERILSRLKSDDFKVLRRAESLVSHDTSTCGLHVTIDQAGMSVLHQSKFVVFLNSEANQQLIEAVCRRYKTGYCKIKPQFAKVAGLERKFAQDAERHDIVNFANEGLIEFRGARGTLKFESIMAVIEFTRMAWLFSENTSIAKLATPDFLAFICQREWVDETKYLRPLLIEKKLLKLQQPVAVGVPRRLTMTQSFVEAEVMGFITKSMDI
jgi:hypothetical protein